MVYKCIYISNHHQYNTRLYNSSSYLHDTALDEEGGSRNDDSLSLMVIPSYINTGSCVIPSALYSVTTIKPWRTSSAAALKRSDCTDVSLILANPSGTLLPIKCSVTSRVNGRTPARIPIVSRVESFASTTAPTSDRMWSGVHPLLIFLHCTITQGGVDDDDDDDSVLSLPFMPWLIIVSMGHSPYRSTPRSLLPPVRRSCIPMPFCNASHVCHSNKVPRKVDVVWSLPWDVFRKEARSVIAEVDLHRELGIRIRRQTSAWERSFIGNYNVRIQVPPPLSNFCNSIVVVVAMIRRPIPFDSTATSSLLEYTCPTDTTIFFSQYYNAYDDDERAAFI